MSKRVLQCEYCRHLISENDVKCPNCGANCSDIIKKYKEELIEEERIKEEKLEEERKEKEEQVRNTAKAVAIGFGATTIMPFIIFGCVIVFVFIVIAFSAFHNVKSSNTGSKESIQEKLNISKEGEGYNITVDKYELFEYEHRSFRDCNTKEGHQRVAFYITIENTSDKTINTTSIVNRITLKADNEMVSSVSVVADDSFCNVKSGKASYTKLSGTNLLANDKVSGYLGYEVPTSAKKLKFIITDDLVIEMDNPVYKESK